MALEQDIARLVTAADRLTEVVDNKVDEIDAAVTAFKTGTVIQEEGGLYFEQYDTGLVPLSLEGALGERWLSTPIALTVSQSGLYSISLTIHQNCLLGSAYQGNKIRVVVGVSKENWFRKPVTGKANLEQSLLEEVVKQA